MSWEVTQQEAALEFGGTTVDTVVSLARQQQSEQAVAEVSTVLIIFFGLWQAPYLTNIIDVGVIFISDVPGGFNSLPVLDVLKYPWVYDEVPTLGDLFHVKIE